MINKYKDDRYIRLVGFVEGKTKAQHVHVRKTDIIKAAMEEMQRLFINLLLIEEE